MSDRRAQEELLNAWMEMSVGIRGNRILSGFSFNEIMICGLLYRRAQQGLPPCTATELCGRMHLLKSQMNHLLTGMESRGLIRRERSETDRRAVYVRLQPEAEALYLAEHEKVLGIVETVRSALGAEDAALLTELMRRATAVVNDNLSKEDL